MNMSFIKLFFRRMIRNKSYFYINTIGLTIGITCFLLIALWVKYELSFDRSFKYAERIFRIYPDIDINGNNFTSSMAPPPLAEALVRQFPEVLKSTRVWSYNNKPVSNEMDSTNIITFNEKYFYQADSTFFEIFSIRMLEGNPKNALAKPFNMVLTEDAAIKYFGEEAYRQKKVLGKSLTISFSGKKYACEITGITENVPANAHFHYNVILSNSSDPWWQSTVWIDNTYYTYILLREGADAKALEAKLPEIVKTYLDPQIQLNFGTSYDQLKAAGNHWDYKLQALTDIHLYSNFERELQPNGDIKNIRFLGLVALLLIIIACINYANLTTAHSFQRSKEVGIRKYLGSGKRSLQLNFFAESGMLTAIAILLALILSFLLLKPFSHLMGVDLPYALLISGFTCLLVIGIFLFVSFLGGAYPALYISSFDAIAAIRNKITPKRSFINTRSSLVILQFAISIGLIISAWLVYQQLSYIQEKSPGFNKENILIIADPALKLRDHTESFLKEVRENPGVKGASYCWDFPGSGYDNFPISANNRMEEEDHILTNFKAGYDFMKTFDIPLVAGRDFNEIFDKDVPNRVILNERAVKELKLKDPVGKLIFTKELNVLDIKQEQQEVVGVVKDFNFESLHSEIRPMIIFLDKRGTFLSIRLQGKNIQRTINDLNALWRKYLPTYPFEFSFVNDHMNRLYKTEMNLSRILAVLTFLLIIVTVIGLFGLTHLMLLQRTKETGIRKVLGASVLDILYLLNKSYLKWILIALLIASPITYFIMSNWLGNFAFRIDIPMWIFGTVGILTIAGTLLTASFQSISASLQNPVKSLRNE